jgi:anti-sigma B factor antagonist
MEIEQTVDGQHLLLTLTGDFDTTDVDTFSAQIATAIDGGIVLVAMDLTELTFINSTGLGCLLRAQKQLAQYGGGLTAVGANPRVAKTFRILELDRRIPLFGALDEARAHLEKLSPEGVSGGGEEVEFLLPDAKEAFGERPRRGKITEIEEDGLTFNFENLDRLDVDAVFPRDATIQLKFRIPLYHPSHVFDVAGKLAGVEVVGLETVTIHVRFTEISDPEQEAIRQYVKDLRYLGDEV